MKQSLVVESGENNEERKILYKKGWSKKIKIFKPIMNEIKSEGYLVEIIDLDSNQNKSLAIQCKVSSNPSDRRKWS